MSRPLKPSLQEPPSLPPHGRGSHARKSRNSQGLCLTTNQNLKSNSMDSIRMGRMGFRQSLPHLGPSTQSILTLSLVRPILILTAAIYHHILRQHNTSWGPLAGSFKTTVCGLGTTTLDERFIHSGDLFLHGLRIPRLLPLTSYAPTTRKCDPRRNSRFLRPLPLLCISKYLSPPSYPPSLHIVQFHKRTSTRCLFQL